MIASQIIFAVIVVTLTLAAAAVIHSLWRGLGTVAEKHIANQRETFEALFACLWSREIHRRFAALLIIRRMVRFGRIRDDVIGALISFIRDRLSAPDKETIGGFEDIRLALAILSSRAAFSFRRAKPIDLTGIDFSGTPLFGIDFRGFRLIDCSFNRCLAMRASFSGCDLAGTSFAGADLRGADFSGSDLSDASLVNANLTGARLTKARIVSTNISGAILVDVIGLEQEQLDAAFGDAGTAVPEQLRFVPMKSQRAQVRLRPVADVE